MISRLFVGNFDFEHQLAVPGRVLSQRLQRINAELATSWLAIAEDGDHIWTPQPLPDDFWKGLAKQGLPDVRGVAEIAPSADQRLVPWGWTSDLQGLCLSTQSGSVPSMNSIRTANSRRWSAAREADWKVGLPFAAAANTLDEATAAIDDILKWSPRWVIKAEFGMSGRERILGAGPLTDQHRRWITRRLAADGVVFVEPWVDAVREAGLQFDVPQEGPCRFLGIAEMLPSARGQYTGTLFAAPQETNPCDWSPAIAVAMRAVEELQTFGYFGPVGIDAMWYRSPDGRRACRPLQDINARWTMGRLALGWRKRFPDAAIGYWWHGSSTEFATGRHLEPLRNFLPAAAAIRILRTSPISLNDDPRRHVSALVWSDRGASWTRTSPSEVM